MILLLNQSDALGVTIYDDCVSRAGDLGAGLFVLEADGRSVQFDVLSTDRAVKALRAKVPTRTLSLVEAGRAVLDHVAEGLPDDG